MRVFFYGLFMDESLLGTKGIEPSEVSLGFVDGYGLRIGARATLVRRPDSRAYGAMMDITADEATELYAEESVADYVPEPVIVELMDGTRAEATCYNLPSDKVTGTNKEYAESLLDLATRLDFPDSYLDQIRQART
ncbi:MAG: gamma-glutamylcyclotransferase [Pirellulales bacterium]|nr:gamma-glutamylcyclotransferase [Pirellulales bacterium]